MMELGVATHFGQGWSTYLLTTAEEIGVSSIRDSVYWDQIEKTPGQYNFSARTAVYPDQIAARDLELTLIFNRPNPLYDGGGTPYTPTGRAAFAEFVAAALARFPEVDRIEIGNEFNTQNFVSGHVKSAPYETRAVYYTAILKAVHDRIEDDFPDVEILGGATHSVSVGYLKKTFAAGALDYSDGIAFHPYTSKPEQLASHLELLRAAMGENVQPLYATEFSLDFDDADDAPAYLVKMSAVMAAADVASAYWYALREQPWYNEAALLSGQGAVRPAGDAFEFLQETVLAAGPAERLASASSAHLYSFGDTALVAWGAERSINLGPGVTWYDARGQALPSGVQTLDPDKPIIAVATAPTDFSALTLGPKALVADSYFDFDVTDPRGLDGSPWSYFKMNGFGLMSALSTMNGGDRQNEPWRPYIGDTGTRPLFIDETMVRPVDFGNGASPAKQYAVVERYTAEQAFKATILGEWTAFSTSTDGVEVRIILNGVELFSSVDKDPILVRLDNIWLELGDTLDFIVDPGASAVGDATSRRISIYESDLAPS